VTVKARLFLAAIAASMLVGWSIGEAFGFGGLINDMAIFLIIPFILMLIFAVRRSNVSSWQQIFLACGVPLGLLWVVVGFHGLTLGEGESSAIYAASAIGFLTILYGGIVSAIGYFAMDTRKIESNRLSLKVSVCFVILLVGLVLWAYDSAFGIYAAMSMPALSLIVACMISALWFKGKMTLTAAAETSLFASMFTLIVGLIFWFHEEGDSPEALSMMLCGLSYGLLIYISLFIFSLSAKDRQFLDVGRANWHWLEITSFLVFMLFAPETIREMKDSEESESVRVNELNQLELRLADYEDRITKLERQRDEQ
jgi:hypothetical protein